MRKILIPTDFSENAMKTINYAFKIFSGEGGTEFILVNSYDAPSSGSNTMLLSIVDILRKDSEDGLEKAKSQLNSKGQKVTTRSIYGSLVESINDLCTEEGIDLVVMGTHGASGIEKFLMGSNTAAVARGIKKPLLVVPSGSEFKSPGRILFATDFKGPKPTGGLDSLKELALMFGAEVVIFNVHKQGTTVDLDKSASDSGIKEELNGLKISCHAATGDDVVQTLYQSLKKLNIDFMAMIAHQHSFFGAIFHKNITSELAMGIKVPMLVLHN